MAATRPVMYTEVTDAELSAERPVSEETIHKIMQNVNMMRALCPVGEIIPIQVNIPGVPAPATTIWQLANGGSITEPSSPLNGVGDQAVPDMNAFYLRGGASGNVSGGQHTINLTHTHAVQNEPNPFGNVIQRDVVHHFPLSDTDPVTAFVANHDHGNLSSDLTAPITIDPLHMECTFYFKIG